MRSGIPAEESNRKRRTRSDDDWVVTTQKSSVLLQVSGELRSCRYYRSDMINNDRREEVKHRRAF
jgi:hypothetical protein